MTAPYAWLRDSTWGIWKANFTFPGPIGHGQITAGYSSSGDAGPLNPNQDASNIFDALDGHIMPLLHSGCTLVNVETVLNNGGTIQEGISANSPASGGITEVLTLPSACFLVRKETGQIGKTNRGRWYIPGVSQDSINNTDGCTLTSGAMTAWEAAVLALLAAFSSAELPLALVRKTTNPALYRNVGVTQLVIEPQLSEQTRRNRRVAHR